jgi:phosphotransferase system HPr (HPr) family protein
MKRSRVVVPWKKGLHLLPAARLARLTLRFHSTIFIRCGEKMADLRSVLSILTLCAAMGTALDVRATGDDERDATAAVEAMFSADDDGDAA